MRTFPLPLPEHLHDALRAETTAERRPPIEILRRALETWLAARRRQRLAADIQGYAEAVAGTELDLHADLEAAGAEAPLAGEDDR
jgi:hypothetical protein